jgi:NAD(P)-dependent dehydrogenase (short-subunit alcohol dehydrogenase family)
MKDFKGKTAVITGAASGIGFALAERCAREGMKLVLGDIEGAALKKAEESLRQGGAEVLAVPTDVSSYADVVSLAERTVAAYGGIHLLCNNAGVQTGQGVRYWEDTLNDWQWVVGVNLWGAIHGVKAFLPAMLAGGEPGHIVNTASIAGLVPNTAISIYSVTKAAIIMLSECLSMQLQEEGASIGVTVACPGNVRTQLNNAERNRPAELASPREGPITQRQREVTESFTKENAEGLPPEEFAGLIFDGIREDRLYVISHPEYRPAIEQRMKGILAGVDATVPEPSTKQTPLD